MERARRLAGFKPAQNWAVLALLLFFGAVLTLNLAAVLAVLPQLVRILTGYESAYSRSGMYFISNPTFVLLALVISWLAFDPFVQAVYSVRCFQAESQETGEDLRCRLRQIRTAARVPVAFALLLMIATPLVRAQVSPETLEKSAQQAMQAPEYDWRFPPAKASSTPGIIRILDRVIDAIRHAASAVGDVVKRIVKWIFDKFFPKGAVQPNGAPPGAGLNWVVAGLIALVVCAGALLAWRRQRVRRPKPAVAPVAPTAIHLESPELSPDALPEDQWLELADRCLAEQNFRLALRALYLACLAWLGRREVLSIHPGKTNHEYERELARRTREVPAVRPLFAGNVTAFERAWYGLHDVTAEETSEFRQRTADLKSALTPTAGALS